MATTKVQSELIVDDVALAGNPTTTTQSAGNNTTRIATTAFVTTAINNLINSAPGTLDTLDEIAAALNDDPSFTTTVNNAIATKLPLAGGTMSGALNMGANQITNSGKITSTELTITGGSDGADVYINNTSPTLAFTDSNSYSDSSDMYIVRGGSTGDLQFQFYDDSANSTTTTFEIDETGNTTIAGTISSGAITSSSTVTGTQLKAATGSTTAAVLKLEDAGVATYDFSFPDTGTILLGVNDQSGTTSDKVLKLENAGSGKFGLRVEGDVTLPSSMLLVGDIKAIGVGGLALQTDEGTKRLFINDDGKIGISAGGVIYAGRFSVGKPPARTPGSAFTSSTSSFFSEATLGNSKGDDQKIAIFAGEDGSNVSGLALYRYRRVAGSNWTGDGFSLRQEVDNTENIYDYINFAGGKVGMGTVVPDEFDGRANNLVVQDTGDGGITIVSGDSSDARLAFTIAADTGLSNGQIHYNNGNDQMHFATGGSDRFIIKNNGYLVAQGAQDMRLVLGSVGSDSNNSSNWIRAANTNLMYNSAGAEHIWEITGTQNMKLATNGVLTLDQYSYNSNTGIQLLGSTGRIFTDINYNTYGAEIILINNQTASGSVSFLQYRTNSNTEGSLLGDSSGLTISNNSDYRKKKEIRDLTGSLDVINSLQPRLYKYRAGFGKPTTDQVGFIAHEIQEKMPALVNVEKDRTYTQEDIDAGATGVEVGDPYYQTVAYSHNEMITRLVGAIQELKAENDALKTRIEALEG